jgi:hypothetical protein
MKEKRTVVDISQSLYERIKRWCAERGIKKGWWVDKTLSAELDKPQKPK